MRYEIEMKAWAKDRAAVERRLLEIGRFLHREGKTDTYFGHKRSDRLAFRLREGEGGSLVTVKRKKIRQKMEVSQETEFAVSSAAAFCDFAKLLGYEPREFKRKTTNLFEVDGFSVELNSIEGLGDFVEIERLADNPNDAEALRKAMIAIFARLGLNEEQIEKRSYRELLARVEKPKN